MEVTGTILDFDFTQDFQIAIDGEDGKATQFRRLHTKLFSPVLIKLDIHPFPSEF